MRPFPAMSSTPQRSLAGLKAYGQMNLAAGAEWDAFSLEIYVSNVFDERGELSRFEACGSCGQRPYIVPDHAAHHRSACRGQVLMA